MMSEDNIVLISEYNMPNDFECIWEQEITCTLDNNKRSKKVERLFRWKDSSVFGLHFKQTTLGQFCYKKHNV